MTEKDFHTARRMFAVRDGTVLVAPPNYPYTHFEWLASLVGAEDAHGWIDNHVRGYVLERTFVAYRGTEFSHRVNHEDVLAAIDVLEKIHFIEEIGIGVFRNCGDQPWEPKNIYTVSEYRELANAKLNRSHRTTSETNT